MIESERNLQYLRILPFYDLNDIQLSALTGNWGSLLDEDIDLYNVLPNPDRNDENDPESILRTPISNYYSLTKLNNILNLDKNTMSIFHFNTRSLPKNISILKDFLYSVEKWPDIIGISETKLNDQTVTNIEIP